MTAIGIAAPAAFPSGTRLRLTQRGRRVLAVVAALPAVIALGAGILGGGAALASLDQAPVASFETVVVGPGESLWAIAERIAPNADPRDVVDDLVRLNTLGGVTVSVGEELAIPQAYVAGE